MLNPIVRNTNATAAASGLESSMKPIEKAQNTVEATAKIRNMIRWNMRCFALANALIS